MKGYSVKIAAKSLQATLAQSRHVQQGTWDLQLQAQVQPRAQHCSAVQVDPSCFAHVRASGKVLGCQGFQSAAKPTMAQAVKCKLVQTGD